METGMTRRREKERKGSTGRPKVVIVIAGEDLELSRTVVRRA